MFVIVTTSVVSTGVLRLSGILHSAECYVHATCVCYSDIPGDTVDMLAIFFANWHSPATLTEVFPHFFLSCKANARVYLAKTGHSPHSS